MTSSEILNAIDPIRKQVSDLLIFSDNLIKEDQPKPIEITKLQVKLKRKNNSLTRLLEQLKSNQKDQQDTSLIDEISLLISNAEDVLDDLQVTLDFHQERLAEEAKKVKEEQERQDKKVKEEQERQDKKEADAKKFQLELSRMEMEQENNRLKMQIEQETKRFELEEETKRMQEKLRKDLESERITLEINKTCTNNQNSSIPITAKLPKLQLPIFNGSLLRWQEFWDCFVVAIHENPSLKPVDKLNYLKCSLEGKAKQSLEGLQVTNENYTVAVDILKERFGDRERVIKAHYAALNDIPASSTDLTKLQHTCDQIEKSIRSLEALGENVESNLLVCLIKSKLSEETMFKLEEHKRPDESWSVSSLRAKLKWLITIQTSAKENCGQGTKAKSRLHSGSTMHSTTEALLVANQNSRRNCIFCNGDHWNDQCGKFKTIKARKAQIKGCCFICFRKDHQMKDCRSRKRCFYCKKERMHHSSLCPGKFLIGQNAQERQANSHSELVQVVQETTVENPPQEGSLLACGEKVLMQTAKTFVQNPQRTSQRMQIRLLLDSGSHRTYISSRLANELQLRLGKKEKLAILTFGSSNPTLIDTQMTSIKIQLKDGNFFTIKAHVVPDVAGVMERVPIDVQSFNGALDNLALADDILHKAESTKIELLIGNDYYGDLLLPQKVSLSSGLYLLNSKLGWIISGRVKNSSASTNENEVGLLCIDSRNQRIKDDIMFATDDPPLFASTKLSEFWQLETLGIKEPIDQDDEKLASQNFLDTVKYEDGRYYVTWPWKEENPNLPDNYNLSKARLKATLNRLKRDKNLLQKYDDIIQDQVKKGVIEKVTAQSDVGTKEHYIPHHPVVTPTKATTKIRIVYDASAKLKKSDKSLNECLHKGPILLQNLCGLLMRFQLHPIAIIADIEKAFLQVGIQLKDRDVTRFMWLKDPTCCETEGNVDIYRFCRIPFGIISSPSLLMSTIQFHLNKFETPIAKKLQENIYVDNVIVGARSVEEAINLYEESKNLFNRASMNLREWTSNSKEFTCRIPEGDRANGNVVKVLGIKWDLETDTLTISGPNEDALKSVKTKRQVLKMIASLYDPLGYFSPATLVAKLFFQSLCTDNVAWDDQLSENKLIEWQKIAESLYPIPMIQKDRLIDFSNSESSRYQLVCFSDASASAFAAVIYLRISNGNDVKSTLIFSKCRLTPIKKVKLSIPRLELLAVLIGCRALQFVKAQLNVRLQNMILYSDSQCVLHWINSEKQLSVFVSNRLKEIKDTGVSFRYINTNENPADIATRGKSAIELKNCLLWQHGPSWLNKEENFWPEWNISKADGRLQNLIAAEEKKTVLYETSLLIEEDLQEPNSKTPFGIQETRYSSFSKLIRVTAWALRFIQKMRKQSSGSGELTAREILLAEEHWILQKQKQYYHDIFRSLHTESNRNKHNLINQLGLHIDDQGMIRCYGRLENAAISPEAIYPILLPRKDYFTELLIISYHKRLLHAGVSQTLAAIRNKYWLPKGRSEVRRVTNTCHVCRKWEGGAFKMPKMPPFPKFRVSPSAPFTYVGVDYFGPLYIRGNQKVWVCLFTCLAIRAIHLELLPDLSTEQFLLGLRRMIAKYGKPSFILSDNAKQFKLSKSTLDKVWTKTVKSEEIVSYCANEGIEWKFIVNLAPWMGGCYERMIGLVKRSLRKSLYKTCLTWNQLSTILCEVQAVINTRPLIYVGDDINSKDILTPSHFLSLNPKIGTPEYKEDTTDQDLFTKLSTAGTIIQNWKKGQNRINQFWDAWRNSYLLGLRERYQSEIKHNKKQSSSTPMIGDVVLIKEKLPRGSWKMAKISNLFKGRDGKIRSAQLMLPSHKTVNRPISLLCPIELNSNCVPISR